MRAVLEHCSGQKETYLPAQTVFIREGETTGDLYILVEGELEVLKGDTVVAVVTEPGAILGEMSVLLHQPHTATVRASTGSTVHQIDDGAEFLRARPAAALLVATLLAQRLNAATTYLADIKRQYAGHGNHLEMVGDVLESLVNLSATKASPGSDRQPERLPDSRL
ncbi:cyclic nucleotide-binding domain-containing protein [Bradyrhizobium sp. G127]|jgi:CRP-like cAMP-binding protein|uniref:cyclic nucleotide-binding domain-containing protein n=1 Tax=Bradyrhizobium sp. G127 TaxID=2904800 RepID=UPI001F2F5CBE|nr:cyclic nucleotide-binding domain-containing protein [Bradyrhizobium sp. G127]MCF2524210.1 cyclic nucleotide-binding domain-containing protein [Bradyrhizobium sp. G127]